ncbi:MAG: carbon-nitrogen hydrolase family protein [Bacteroidota bacterium]
MKICLAQTKYHPGDIRQNDDQHRAFILKAIELGAGAIYFPELSLTGYEPERAEELSFQESDLRFLPYQVLSSENNITIGLGVPVQRKAGFTISMAIFQPQKAHTYYDKKYLHVDELPFFIPGENLSSDRIGDGQTAMAICYELSIEEHATTSVTDNVCNYLASVAKYRDDVKRASRTLSEIARKFSIHTLMVNGIGPADGGVCTGSSAIWDTEGKQLLQLGEDQPGLILFDTVTHEVQSVVM